ncbi:hypothetical protein Tsubulata_038897 [Turnera subulata]|uniref:Uncharacterized protein n=1 Tax=Turnera subulata TaxID=218843 RepID=A0A9Q0FQ36_9ROSI|nr:hypothetical protein Tsubulata_038897 [Turnera subulata]
MPAALTSTIPETAVISYPDPLPVVVASSFLDFEPSEQVNVPILVPSRNLGPSSSLGTLPLASNILKLNDPIPVPSSSAIPSSSLDTLPLASSLPNAPAKAVQQPEDHRSNQDHRSFAEVVDASKTRFGFGRPNDNIDDRNVISSFIPKNDDVKWLQNCATGVLKTPIPINRPAAFDQQRMNETSSSEDPFKLRPIIKRSVPNTEPLQLSQSAQSPKSIPSELPSYEQSTPKPRCPHNTNPLPEPSALYRLREEAQSSSKKEAAAARNVPHQVTRSLVEIRDVYPPLRIDPNNPWQIKKRITSTEIVFLLVIDYTDHESPQKFQSDNLYFKNGPDNSYFLGMIDVVRGKPLNPGDEVGLFWDVRTGTFGFKVLRRGSSFC